MKIRNLYDLPKHVDISLTDEEKRILDIDEKYMRAHEDIDMEHMSPEEHEASVINWMNSKGYDQEDINLILQARESAREAKAKKSNPIPEIIKKNESFTSKLLSLLPNW